MKGIRYRSGPFKLKSVDRAKSTFDGYASVFGNVDSYDDVVERGAFTKTLVEFGKRVKVLWQHDPMCPIGRPSEMEEDDKGLHVVAKISETTLGKDAMVLLEDGTIDELSIGYTPIKWTYDKESGLTRLHEVKLWEFSLVTWAANDLAVVQGVKTVEDAMRVLHERRDVCKKIASSRALSHSTRSEATAARDALAEALKQVEALLGTEPARDATPAPAEPPPPETDPGFQSALVTITNDMRGLSARRAG